MGLGHNIYGSSPGSAGEMRHAAGRAMRDAAMAHAAYRRALDHAEDHMRWRGTAPVRGGRDLAARREALRDAHRIAVELRDRLSWDEEENDVFED